MHKMDLAMAQIEPKTLEYLLNALPTERRGTIDSDMRLFRGPLSSISMQYLVLS